jgi:hypothetical protein
MYDSPEKSINQPYLNITIFIHYHTILLLLATLTTGKKPALY